eukprot:129884-Rhodomonas_salina.2
MRGVGADAEEEQSSGRLARSRWGERRHRSPPSSSNLRLTRPRSRGPMCAPSLRGGVFGSPCASLCCAPLWLAPAPAPAPLPRSASAVSADAHAGAAWCCVAVLLCCCVAVH